MMMYLFTAHTVRGRSRGLTPLSLRGVPCRAEPPDAPRLPGMSAAFVFSVLLVVGVAAIGLLMLVALITLLVRVSGTRTNG